MFNIFIVWTDGTPKTWYDRVRTKEKAERIKQSFAETEPGYLTEYTVSVEPKPKKGVC